MNNVSIREWIALLVSLGPSSYLIAGAGVTSYPFCVPPFLVGALWILFCLQFFGWLGWWPEEVSR